MKRQTGFRIPGAGRRAPTDGPHDQLACDILSRIGNTPLCRLKHTREEFPGIEFLFKAEWCNPSGSVKDRSAYNMIRAAERRGALKPGQTILDASSGNNGTSLAMIGAVLGYPVTICLPSSVTTERRRVLEAYGAELRFTDPAKGSDGAISYASELATAYPKQYYYVDQYSNPANWQAHYFTTAEEIWRQTHGRITHFVAAIGTGGTFVGVARRLLELNSRICCASLQPDSPRHSLRGMKHMASAFTPAIYDPSIADENFGIATESAQAMVRRVARQEGLLLGVTSGAALVGCFELARNIRKPAVIVTVFADNADKYMTEPFWQER